MFFNYLLLYINVNIFYLHERIKKEMQCLIKHQKIFFLSGNIQLNKLHKVKFVYAFFKNQLNIHLNFPLSLNTFTYHLKQTNESAPQIALKI